MTLSLCKETLTADFLLAGGRISVRSRLSLPRLRSLLSLFRSRLSEFRSRLSEFRSRLSEFRSRLLVARSRLSEWRSLLLLEEDLSSELVFFYRNKTSDMM
jgi:hypothetical protein